MSIHADEASPRQVDEIILKHSLIRCTTSTKVAEKRVAYGLDGADCGGFEPRTL